MNLTNRHKQLGPELRRSAKEMSSLHIEHRIPTVAEYHLLREHVGWGTPDVEASTTSLANALFSVCLIKEGELIGIGRIIGDGGLFFYIQDLIVREDQRRKGYCNMIMEELLAYLRKNVRKGAFVALFSAKNVEGLYEKYGFIERPNENFGAGMFLPFEKLTQQIKPSQATPVIAPR